MKAVENYSLYLFYVDKISCAVQNIREKTSQSLSHKQRLTESEFQFKSFIFRARFFQELLRIGPNPQHESYSPKLSLQVLCSHNFMCSSKIECLVQLKFDQNPNT